MTINKKRLEKDIQALAEFNATPGNGVTRSAWSKEESLAKEYLINEMEKIGLDIKIDGIGTIFGTRKGTDPSLPCIMIGSHYDTVVNGGKYDGVVGTVAALETMRVLEENNFNNKYPIVLIAMNAEEGETFGPSTGVSNSRAMVGTLTETELDLVKNRFNQTKREVMYDYGIKPDLKSSVWAEGSIKNFIELHIEQGPVLEEENIDIGLVEYLPGIGRYHVILEGETGDSTVKQSDRKDVITALSHFTLLLNNFLKELGEGITGGVNQVDVSPNSNQFVPDYAELKVELRTFDVSTVKNVDITAKIEELLQEVESKTNVKAVLHEMKRINYPNPTPPSVMDSNAIEIMKSICDKNDFSYRILNNGTGHDAMIMTDFCPTNLVYVPSHKGYTHQPEEYTELDDIVKGAKLVHDLVVELDNK